MVYDPFAVSEFLDCEPDFLVSEQHAGWYRNLGFDDTLYSTKYVFRAYEPIDDENSTNDPTGTLVINGVYNTDNEFWVFEHSDEIVEANKGDYAYDLIVVRTSDSAEKILSSGYMKFFLGTDDRRTHAEIMIAKITSVLEGRADSDINNYSIKGRSVDKMAPKELIEWLDYYRVEVQRTGGSVNIGADRKEAKTNTARVRFV